MSVLLSKINKRFENYSMVGLRHNTCQKVFFVCVCVAEEKLGQTLTNRCHYKYTRYEKTQTNIYYKISIICA